MTTCFGKAKPTRGCSGATCCNQRDYCRGVRTQSSGALVWFPGGNGFHQVGTQLKVFYLLGQNHGPYGASLDPGPRVSADPTRLLPAGGPGSREDAACCHHGTRNRRKLQQLSVSLVLIPRTSAGACKPNWSSKVPWKQRSRPLGVICAD